jgi:hypothetical protein
MKIVRLESKPNLTESQFQNDLSIPVQIKTNGEVALKSITFNLNELKFNIPRNKYKINFFLDDDLNEIIRENYVPGGQYDIIEFLRILRILLNYQLASDQPLDSDLGFGFEWNIELQSKTEGYYTSISYYRNEQATLTTENLEIEKAVDGTGNIIESIIYDEPFFYRNEAIATDTDYNSGFQSIIENNRGAWNLSVTIRDRSVLADIKNSNWLFGIGPKSSLNRNNFNTLAQQLYVGLGVKDTKYIIKKNGVFQNALIEGETISPLTGDVLDIYKIYDGEVAQVMYKIQSGVNIYELEGDVITLQSPISSVSTADTYLVCKIQDDIGKIQFTDITMNPTGTKELVNGQYIATTNKKTIYNTNYGDVEPSLVVLSMLSETSDPYEFSKLLGFRSNIYEETAISSIIESRNRIDYNTFPNDLVIEIDELNLDGYDHGVKTSRNIVMTISAADLKQAITQTTIDSLDLSYTEPAQFLFIGMNNGENNKTLSNLTIRASINGKLLNINGGMSATLLFRDDRDKKVMI